MLDDINNIPAPVIMLLAGFVIGALLYRPPDSTEEPNTCTTYHEMREIYEATNAEYGWPKGAIRGCE